MGWRDGGAAAFVAVTLVVPVVVGAVVVVAQDRSPMESAVEPAPVLGEVTASQRSEESEVALSLRPSQAAPVRTAAMGMVTRVLVAPGQDVGMGAVLVQVGDADVVAYQSDAPLHADVEEGSTGPTVLLAQRILTDLGHYRGPIDGKVRTATVAAIVEFNKAHGLGMSRVLSTASLAWLGPQPVVPRELLVHAGDAVEAGADLFEIAAEYVAIDVTSTGVLPDGALVLEVAGRAAPLDRETMTVTEPEFVAHVVSVLGADAAEDGGTGRIRLEQPAAVGVLPASAVVSDEGGQTCFFPDVDSQAVLITPSGGSLGTVDVDAALVGRTVLVNPREVRTDVDCG
jgi:peptidoglycan hydrolase-like protein with peptidoglycan-binding domain